MAVHDDHCFEDFTRLADFGKYCPAPFSPGSDQVADLSFICRIYVGHGEQLGQLAEANNIFRVAVKECPGNAMAWNNLAVVAQAEGNPKAAENYLRKAL